MTTEGFIALNPETRNLKPILVAGLVSATLTLLLYGGALALPFYSDDLLQVPWVEGTRLVDFWHTVGPYRDYRPLHFTLWRLLYLLTGDLRPGLLHGLNLLGHAACGMLVGLLAARWGGRRWLTASLAAAFFVAFPFAFDAVPWAVGLSYPLATGLALGALLAYLGARGRGSTGRHLAAVALTALAGFSHEGGVAAGPAILLAEWTLLRRGRRSSLWPLAHLVASAVALAAAALARPQGTPLHGLAWPDLAYNGAYALQALLFPVAPLAGLLARRGVDPALAMGVVGLPVLAAMVWVQRVGISPPPPLSSGEGEEKLPKAAGEGVRSPLPLALGWWALWSLPPILTLRFDWLKDAPRAFYPAAVGAALLWADVLNRRGRKGRREAGGNFASFGADWFSAVMALALAALLVAPAGWFVVGRMELQRQVGDLLWEVVDAVKGEGPLLVVNLPSRITPPGRFYPLGHEGLIPLPPRVGADDLVAAHTGGRGRAFERAWGPVLPVLPYAVQLLGQPLTPEDLRAAGRVDLVVYRPDGMGLEEAGAVLPPGGEGEPMATFNGAISLLSVSCTREGPERVVLSTTWRLLEPVEGSPTLFAHLLGDGGELLAQADGDPLRGLYPLPAWQPGEVVQDVRVFEWAGAEPAAVLFGVWEPATGRRWEIVGPGGEPLPEDAFRCLLARWTTDD